MINLISENSFSFFTLFVIIIASLISFNFIFDIYKYCYIIYSKLGYINESIHKIIFIKRNNIIRFVNFNVFSVLTLNNFIVVVIAYILISIEYKKYIRIKYKFLTLFKIVIVIQCISYIFSLLLNLIIIQNIITKNNEVSEYVLQKFICIIDMILIIFNNGGILFIASKSN